LYQFFAPSDKLRNYYSKCYDIYEHFAKTVERKG